MLTALIFLLCNFPMDTVHIKSTISIKVDAREESVWYNADSVLVDNMSEPYYGEKASYKTVAKVLQDRNNLYFLFKIFYGRERPDTRFSGRPDRVKVFLDPLMSKIECYFFTVALTGERNDGIIMADGEDVDYSWDGVWESKVRVLKENGKYRAVVEMKIPFKTLKFKKGQSSWGINFGVSYEQIDEDVWWILPPENTYVKVSMFGVLNGVQARESGKGIELYPVFLTKEVYSSYLGIDEIKMRGGLDMKYKKGAFSMNTTILPDFAEIESDPFTMTLGRAEIYYSEKRPFFLEGQEIFSPSINLFEPIKVFYSRRIGKKFTDVAGEVPVLFGIKLIDKGKTNQLGTLGVLTGRFESPSDTAHYTLWNATSLRHIFGGNSDIGIIGVLRRDMETDSLFYSFSLDGTFRKSRNSMSWQAVINKSDGGKLNGAFQIGGLKYIKRWYFVGFRGDVESDDFDVSPTGYTTLFPGHKGFSMLLGKYGMGKRGSSLRTYSENVSLIAYRDPEDPDVSYGIRSNISIGFQKPVRSGMYAYFVLQREYTKDTLQSPYYSKGVGLSTWVRLRNMGMHLSLDGGYGWNYLRGYRAKSLFTETGVHIPLLSRLEGSYSLNVWSEFQPSGAYRSSTLSGILELTYHFTPFMELSVQNNHVFTHDTVVQPVFARFSLYYSWEIKPKSKLYFVINRLYTKNAGVWNSPEHIYAFKIRYLFLI